MPDRKFPKQVMEEINRLHEEIRRHDSLYYVLDSPEISDAEYDLLFRRLQELERAYPELITPDSPTQRVGGQPLEKFGEVPHALPMLSLSNVFEESEIREFDHRVKRTIGIQNASIMWWNRNWMGSRLNSFMKTAFLCRVPPAATVTSAKMSPQMCAPSRQFLYD